MKADLHGIISAIKKFRDERDWQQLCGQTGLLLWRRQRRVQQMEKRTGQPGQRQHQKESGKNPEN